MEINSNVIVLMFKLVLFQFSLFSQKLDISILFENKFKLYKYTYGTSIENIYQSSFFYKIQTNDTLEIRILTNYKPNIQTTFKTYKFDLKDTVSFVGWDIYCLRSTSFLKAARVKYSYKDSCLMFYQEKIINDKDNFRYSKWFVTPRKFKVIRCNEAEVVFVDKDFIDVKRTYYFRRVKKY